MPPPYMRHVFVCTNRRAEGNLKGCCASKGAEEVRVRLKAELDKAGLGGQVRANAAGCLDACERGVAVVIYPEGVWYGGVTTEDAREIVQKHLVDGKPVDRLRMKLPLVPRT